MFMGLLCAPCCQQCVAVPFLGHKSAANHMPGMWLTPGTCPHADSSDPSWEPCAPHVACTFSMIACRREECTRRLFRRMAQGKETLLERDVRRFAKENGFPQDYVQPFYKSLQQSLPAWDSGHDGVGFRVFRKYVMAREQALHRVFDALDRSMPLRTSAQRSLCPACVHLIGCFAMCTVHFVAVL